MNQLLSYFFYIPITLYITIWVGKNLHRNGRHLIQEALGKSSQWADPINNTLLVGYYCLNFGLALVKIRGWPSVHENSDFVLYLAKNIGDVLLVLGGIHSFNILILTFYISKKQKSISKHKNHGNCKFNIRRLFNLLAHYDHHDLFGGQHFI